MLIKVVGNLGGTVLKELCATSVGEPTLSIQIIYSYLSRYYIPTNSVAPFFTDKLTHNPQFLHSH